MTDSLISAVTQSITPISSGTDMVAIATLVISTFVPPGSETWKFWTYWTSCEVAGAFTWIIRSAESRVSSSL